MPEMKGITVKIPADLHAEVKAYLEAHGMTMGEFIAQAVDNELHPKIQITQEDKNMERMRTLAFQETFILTQQPQEDSTENDVERNVAAEYGMGQQHQKAQLSITRSCNGDRCSFLFYLWYNKNIGFSTRIDKIRPIGRGRLLYGLVRFSCWQKHR